MPTLSAPTRRSAAAVFLVLLACGDAAADRPLNPHAFMEDPARCTTCHASVPVTRSTPLTRDVVSLCRECHFERVQEAHPVDIRPSGIGNVGLPLDSDRTITCATCHDPHGEPYAEVPYTKINPLDRLAGVVGEGGFRTYFLRMPNDEGQICSRCHDLRDLQERPVTPHTLALKDYRGSGSCLPCHGELYDAWAVTLHARTLGDPSSNPGIVAAEFTGDETFGPDEIIRTVGSHWTQRYLLVREPGLRVAREVWSVVDRTWARTYWREQDWREMCAGCHYTGYNPYIDRYVEEGVGCESCHGPGGRHVETGDPGAVVNPADLDPDERDAICASCHTLGHDRTGEFRYPVGYTPGKNLAQYYRGLIPKKGQGPDTFKDDGTLADRLRSFRFWVERFLARRGVNCTLCKSFRSGGEDAAAGSEGPGDMTPAEYCLTCHGRVADTGGPHAMPGSAGVDCRRCHRPLLDGAGRPSIHDHKFVFRKGG